ncbi:hydroxysqualene dehydroxylase HpnE [Variovorax sp. NFACC27]|uniref:hydroxysqualene dehydroxylase HpnE n=1 Tax=unclassified Variovorax TaxID=663243 RepID=UPI00089966A8|nr:squalene-associated FAD-dependent desaturase [Variovorax sp. NFACC28]SEG82007.1 squalene-associated FAD-dependent desaturase [Variovorax sp. NFACC29]SFD09082.1 squalene-associated FAD-dependent desaturase [Variovorax sp. NFACC26]SFG18830.1 squalene-associated FAD-dependent desaturase [Variovorax sp. NFACC27]
MRVAVIGAGWAGLACAVEATRLGHAVMLFEAAHMPGGRARRVDNMHGLALDNGQHIMIGAYTATLQLMRDVGVDVEGALLRMPLSLRFADGGGLKLPRLPAPLDLLAGIFTARGWTWRDRSSLLRTAIGWRLSGFRCASGTTVADLCTNLTSRVMRELIEPLCVSALNTPVAQSSGEVFLRVLKDALFSGSGGADLLLPRADLGALLPDAAIRWLLQRGATVRIGTRVRAISTEAGQWQVDGEAFDRVVLACAPWDAARLVRASGLPAAPWCDTTEALRFEAIATIYVRGATPLAEPMLALRSDPATAPAQFAFDRGQLGGLQGVLAMVVSANEASREVLEEQVIAQAAAQLGQSNLQLVQTVVEKRATFACTPGLARPPSAIAPGLQACGDYVEGPYPATLEGAVLSGLAAAKALAP